MRRRSFRLFAAVALLAGSLITAAPGEQAAAASNVSTFATGLDNPRGLHFGDDGALYVAEGGKGGSTSTVGKCTQVAAPVGPYTGGLTGRISRVSRNGKRTTVIDGLPSSQTSPALGSLVSGVADVIVREDGLDALIAGAGCSHGLQGTSNEIIRVRNGSTRQLVNLSAFLAANPVANPDDNPLTGDFEPDGTWYSMTRFRGALYAVEPNHQELDRITANGKINRLIDFSATFPGNTDWRGPTTVVGHDNSLYVGTLTTFPVKVGAAQVFKVNPLNGQFTVFASGLTTVLGLAFDEEGALYVLEMSNRQGGPAPATGDIVRIKGHHRTTIASGLTFPTAMTLGPDGNLYVSANGLGFPPGGGQVLKVTVPHDGEGD
jgi:hypothetical protein